VTAFTTPALVGRGSGTAYRISQGRISSTQCVQRYRSADLSDVALNSFLGQRCASWRSRGRVCQLPARVDLSKTNTARPDRGGNR